MENNKILISIQFDQGLKKRSIELLVLRDASFAQLLECISYGLEKQKKNEEKVKEKNTPDNSILSYAECLELYRACINLYGTDKAVNGQYWTNMLISMCDRRALESTGNHSISITPANRNPYKRVVFLQSDMDRRLCDMGFVSASRMLFLKDLSSVDSVDAIHEIDTSKILEAFRPSTTDAEIVFPQYNISSIPLTRFDTTPVEIIPPSDPPAKSPNNLWAVMLPAILSIAAMTLMRSFLGGSGANSFLIMTAGMGCITLITTLLTYIRQEKNDRIARQKWKEQYENYINRVIQEIIDRKQDDARNLKILYPTAGSLLTRTEELCNDIFSRSPAHPDFLKVRLGSSDEVENLFEIKGSKKDTVFTPAVYQIDNNVVTLSIIDEKDRSQYEPENYLAHLPHAVAHQYQYMTDAPLIYNFRTTGTLGVVYRSKTEETFVKGVLELFIRRLLYELCYYHSAENLQFVIFFPPAENQAEIAETVSRYTHLPHCRDLFGNRSQFVFSSKAANLVLGSMLELMEERSHAQSESASLPHIIFIVFHEYNLKEHAFAAYLPTAPKDGTAYQNKLGLSFIFAKKYKEYLPEYCTDIIELNGPTDGTATLIPYSDANAKKKFRCELTGNIADESFEKRAFRKLSGIYYTKIAQNRQVPSNVSLFQQFDIVRQENEDPLGIITKFVKKNWGNDDDGRLFDNTKTLAVPIGKTDTGDAILDLHEKADGPHMLVAGTTGSGKSETILSYLIGLCMRFRPDEVNLMLIDMKGGGFTKRLGKLPHVVGKITDIDGDENNTGAEYMLKRFLVAITAEVKRRKLVINHFANIDSVDGYIKKCRETASLSPEDLQYIRENPLTHLFLVIDEFTELKQFSNESNGTDYMSAITKIARIGRSLGIHIILISQNIEGAITDDIRVNAKSRLCLKVATRQASREMIGNDMAAAPSMPGNGRAYLLVGTGSKFEYFQSAYSGVPAAENSNTDMVVTCVEKEGGYSPFYISAEDNPKTLEARKNNKGTQLSAVVNGICRANEELIAAGELRPARMIFRDPLPTSVVYDSSRDKSSSADKNGQQ